MLTLSGEEKIQMLRNGFPSWFYTFQSIFNLLIIVQGVFYSIFSLRTIHHFQYFRKRRLSDFQLSSLKWLRLFVIINIFLWLSGTTGAILEILGIDIFIDLFEVFYFGLTVLTLVLGVFTIQRPELFSEKEDVRSVVFEPVPLKTPEPVIEKLVKEEVEISLKEEKPESNKQDYSILATYIENEKPYLKNDLKMQDLVDATGLSYKRISELLNNDFKSSFYDVMNEYRLKESIRLMKANFHIQHTLTHLAEKAGFNSKTTFNRIFKKHTGQTPTEYIQSLELCE
ncbi:helix-turn-helix domain-containing protein [Limibacter armeniacum]|uniref:helix-turn-helix domain-containing protein n=1 Tax=Limibacter armeniacum TaxID=466084 RepID=UPI002FE6AA1D